MLYVTATFVLIMNMMRIVMALLCDFIVYRFPLDGHDCTVQNYFLKQYNMRLRYPHLPCLHVGPKEKRIFIPLEVCAQLLTSCQQLFQ